MADTYTHKDLAGLCGVSETTIKSYRRKFPGFIPVLTRGKPIRFKPEAGEVCLKIRDCFAKGLSVNETHKVLKEHFKEEPSSRQRRTSSAAAAAPVESVAASAGVSAEYLEKFFATAGQMMQGMAGLATAQAKAEQRLRKVESALERLLEVEAENKTLYARLLDRPTAEPVHAPTEPEPVEPAPQPEPEPQPEQKPEPRMRARRIVNVRGPEGEVASYSLERDTPQSEVRPSDDFLNTPIVIHNDQGEFLGVPGKLPLAGFVSILINEAEEINARWDRQGEAWVFVMVAPDGNTHSLRFISTTTPRGNLVVLLERLDINDQPTSSQFLQEFFRQVKDKA
ncbi:MerR family transcriptional regulator [uncultured Pseudodesulfovibrio sp.]|uniref:MerR family transcriptional regulator n=1 Tax=uncultured Pseudodesulfovibrio sp. TaxID=2035858 RepID=UPI0029C645AB|nr:MerR family transcriptional regulator [uncultured Pseudodesulfovibrio sp.]